MPYPSLVLPRATTLGERELLPPTPTLTAGQRHTLQAALTVFADRGFGGARVRDIAAVAGVQSGNLYNHFASKEAMLASLALIGHQEMLRRQSSALLDCGTDPREQLATMVRAAVIGNCTYPELVRVVTHELGHLSDEALAPTLACWTQLMATLEEVLCRGIDSGTFDVGDLHITITSLGSLVRDLGRWFPHQSVHTAEQVADEYVRNVNRMVGATA